MKTLPRGWPRISSALYYEDPARAIDWLVRAFGFEVRLKVTDDAGAIVHSELVFGEGLVMVAGVSSSHRPDDRRGGSPKSLGGVNTQSLFLYVDDVEAHCARARAAGAAIVTGPKTSDYGEGYWSDRSYEALDCEGHRWWFAERLNTWG